MDQKYYYQGSIFRVIWKILKSSLTYVEENYFLLSQIDVDKFLLISLKNGNRWTSKYIKGENSHVSEKKIIDNLKLSTNQTCKFEEFEYLSNVSEFDIAKIFN